MLLLRLSRLDPAPSAVWLLADNISLHLMQDASLARLGVQLRDRALAEAQRRLAPPGGDGAAPSGHACGGRGKKKGSAARAAADDGWHKEVRVARARARALRLLVLRVVAGQAERYRALLRLQLAAVAGSRFMALVGSFHSVEDVYAATREAALPPRARRDGVYVLLNTADSCRRLVAATMAKLWGLDPTLGMPYTHQSFWSTGGWDNTPVIGEQGLALLQMCAADGLAGELAAAVSEAQLQEAEAQAMVAAGLPPGTRLPQPARFCALLAAARELLLRTPGAGEAAAACVREAYTAEGAAGSSGRGEAGLGEEHAQAVASLVRYGITVLGAQNALVDSSQHPEVVKARARVDAALNPGLNGAALRAAPPETVPLPGAAACPYELVEPGPRLRRHNYGAWPAPSILGLALRGNLAFAQAAKKQLPHLLPGINAPQQIYSQALTSTPVHIEDLALPAINDNLGPAAKLWHVLRPHDAAASGAGRGAGGSGGRGAGPGPGSPAELIAVVRADAAAAAGGHPTDGGVGQAAANTAEALLWQKAHFRDLVTCTREGVAAMAATGGGAAEAGLLPESPAERLPLRRVLAVVQGPGVRVVTVAGYVHHQTVSTGAGIALSSNWPELPAGGWVAHVGAVLGHMADFRQRCGVAESLWQLPALRLLQQELGQVVQQLPAEQRAGLARALREVERQEAELRGEGSGGGELSGDGEGEDGEAEAQEPGEGKQVGKGKAGGKGKGLGKGKGKRKNQEGTGEGQEREGGRGPKKGHTAKETRKGG